MNREGFEARVLELWVTTRVPLTRANVQVATGATRKQVAQWLDAMLLDDVLDVENAADGEVVYTVRGAERPRTGATAVGDLVARGKLARLEKEVRRHSRTLAVATPAPRAPLATRAAGDKSIVGSAALSFFLGPVGWLYAAPLREALPAILAFVLAYKLLPMFLFGPLLAILLPLSALAGGAYAWAHNQDGDRASLGELTRRLGKRGDKT
jgi:hypothetical protein